MERLLSTSADMTMKGLIETIDGAYSCGYTYEQPVFLAHSGVFSPRTCMRNALSALAQFIVNTCVDLIPIMELLRHPRYRDNAVCWDCLMQVMFIQRLLKDLVCGIQSMAMLYDDIRYFIGSCPDACVSIFLRKHLKRLSSQRMTVPHGPQAEAFRMAIGDIYEMTQKQAALLYEFVGETHMQTLPGFKRRGSIADHGGVMRIGRFTIGPTGGGHAQLVLMQKAALATQSHALRQEDAPPAYSAVYPLPGDA